MTPKIIATLSVLSLFGAGCISSTSIDTNPITPAPSPISTSPIPATSTNPVPPTPTSTTIDTSTAHKDLIRVDNISSGQKIKSGFIVQGAARGNWYFEASFPFELKDANGMILASGPVQAQGNWMTTNFVPFTLTLTFPTPNTTTGTLTLKKDNPSGIPANDDQLIIPVTF